MESNDIMRINNNSFGPNSPLRIRPCKPTDGLMNNCQQIDVDGHPASVARTSCPPAFVGFLDQQRPTANIAKFKPRLPIIFIFKSDESSFPHRASAYEINNK